MAVNLICCGVERALVVIDIPLPATNSTTSSPTATRLACPATSQVLNELPKDINAELFPISVTLNPVVVSNLNALTLEIVFDMLPVVYWLTVSGVPTPAS